MKQDWLTIHQLRQEAFTAWEILLYCKGAYAGAAYVHEVDDDAVTERYPWTNEQFKHEVRQRFGDLRRRFAAMEGRVMTQDSQQPMIFTRREFLQGTITLGTWLLVLPAEDRATADETLAEPAANETPTQSYPRVVGPITSVPPKEWPLL